MSVKERLREILKPEEVKTQERLEAVHQAHMEYEKLLKKVLMKEITNQEFEQKFAELQPLVTVDLRRMGSKIYGRRG